MGNPTAITSLIRRDRLVMGFALAGITGLAWLYLGIKAGSMAESPMGMDTLGGMARIRPWGSVDFLLMFLMWSIMMVGMMLPSAAPMILLFAGVSRKARQEGRVFVPVSVFVSGYLLVWTGFSAAATLLQWGLEQAALLSPMMISKSPLLGGSLLLAAGLYQLSPLKELCLTHCRSPFEFVSQHWRPGTRGAFRMGVEHGIYCLGCCWVLMGLLFFGGVMSLLWIAAIAGFVLLEKTLPSGVPAGRISGAALALMGVFVIIQG